MRAIEGVVAVVVLAGCGGDASRETVWADMGSLGGELDGDDATLKVPSGAFGSIVSVALERIPECAIPISQSSLPTQGDACTGDATGFGMVNGSLDFVGSPGVFDMNPYVVSPSDLAFATPATLEVSTQHILLGAGGLARDPSRLDLLRLCTVVNGRWEEVHGSAFDAAAQVVRGAVAGGGRYAITQICADGTIGNCT